MNATTNEIVYTRGDATLPVSEGNRFIVHICNNVGGWGAGFVLAVSNRWDLPEAAYRDYARGCHERGETLKLGALQLVQVDQGLWVVNLIGQIQTNDGTPPIQYPAVVRGLRRVCKFAQMYQASVHMPRIGCGLARGKWEVIEPIILRELSAKGIQVTVYDL